MMNRRHGYFVFWGFILALCCVSCKPKGSTLNGENLKVAKIQYQYEKLDDKYNGANDVSAIIAPYREKLQSDMSRVIGHASDNMFKGKPESVLSNYCSDLLLDAGQDIAKEKIKGIKVDFAMLNNGGLRVPINKGDITVENIFQLMPFENEVVLLQLTGDQVKAFLNYIASRGGESVAGVRFVIKDNKATKALLQNKKIVSTQKYWLITSDYIADGGDGSGVLKKALKRVNAGIRLRDLMIDYISDQTEKGIVISSKLDGRIKNGK
ncbi:MAG: 5'-nucleotidase C-terminal domain-containing protein [Prolixibacteraceae bacterium]